MFAKGEKKPFYIGITDNSVARRTQHTRSGRLIRGREEELEELFSNLDEATARGYEQGCIEFYETLTGTRRKKGEKSNFDPEKPETRGNKCNSFVKNKTRDKKRQEKMVAGRNYAKKINCNPDAK